QPHRTPSMEPLTHSEPSGATAQADSGRGPAGTFRTGAPVSTSQTIRLPSQPADRALRPFGVYAQAKTSPPWPSVSGPAATNRRVGTTDLTVSYGGECPAPPDSPGDANGGTIWLKHSSPFWPRRKNRAAASGGRKPPEAGRPQGVYAPRSPDQVAL